MTREEVENLLIARLNLGHFVGELRDDLIANLIERPRIGRLVAERIRHFGGGFFSVIEHRIEHFTRLIRCQGAIFDQGQ